MIKVKLHSGFRVLVPAAQLENHTSSQPSEKNWCDRISGLSIPSIESWELRKRWTCEMIVSECYFIETLTSDNESGAKFRNMFNKSVHPFSRRD
jgi:hypothetical protein